MGFKIYNGGGGFEGEIWGLGIEGEIECGGWIWGGFLILG